MAKERSILNRRNLLLARLAGVGYISSEEYQRAKQAPLFQKVQEAAPDLPE
jgi:membrane peptidoglycan carboxypeptidase